MQSVLRTWLLILSGSAALAGTARALADDPVNRLTQAEQRSGWRMLFDGTSTEGWRNYKRAGLNPGWKVEDGALVRNAAGAGDIITDAQFQHFELQLEYRISKGGNSGLMFHVTEEADAPWQTGPEVQIQDNLDGHDPEKSGWLYQLYRPRKPQWAIRFEKQVGFQGIDVDDATRPAGEWNHLYLRVTATDGEVCVNGVSYYHFSKGSDDWNRRVAGSKFAAFPLFGKSATGHICLQDHGNPVSFRSIKIRELPADGKAINPIDGTLPIRAELAFPDMEWEGWSPANDDGKLNPPLRTIHITHAGDGSGRLFLVDQSGMIHVVPQESGSDRAPLFADLRPRVHPFSADDEEGLLGFAFHPQYKSNGQFFVYYNTRTKPRTILVSRFRVSKENPEQADLDSEEVLMTIAQPFANHNGGPMCFGPDGYLYIALGDGGGRNDPTGTSQSLQSPLGCVLRIDVDHQGEGKPYAIPADNPFVGNDEVLPEIYAYGFRNPWRMAFDEETGALWLADVGQDRWEEIDIVTKGGNYGWSVREGTYLFGNTAGAHALETIAPVWEYDHQIGLSITGGHVYRGTRFPELAGHYIYGDFVTGLMWALHYDQQHGRVVRNMAIPWNGLPVLAFGAGEDGEMYVTTPAQNGRGIYRFVADDARNAPK